MEDLQALALEDEFGEHACEICGAFPIRPVLMTLEDEPVTLCQECASHCHVGHWRAR